MLYDPKWEKPSLTGFIDWLGRQDPETKYNWHHCQGCVFGQYWTVHTGVPKSTTQDHADIAGGYPQYTFIGAEKPWTFGAALDRAQKLKVDASACF